MISLPSIGLLALLGCPKVPLYSVNAAFDVADASWFEEEETLFIFWELEAEQGLGDNSVIEITWATDKERVDWTPVNELEMVHTHIRRDCGITGMCGSASVRIELEPREVQVRLRYNSESELALEPGTVFNVVRAGAAHESRSLVIYGVFDETNQWVQWRGRHQFPTLRNEQAQLLGLRRQFEVGEQGVGVSNIASDSNPYAYGVTCPDNFISTGDSSVSTEDRAAFNDQPLPLTASNEPMVCAPSTVTDATGTFTTDAWTRKNPEVRPAFPLLRSPVEETTRLDFFIAPCSRIINEDHEEMQRQRLLLPDLPAFCADDWQDEGWVDELVVAITDAIEDTRPDGKDMVLVIGLNRDEEGLALAVEDALAQVVPEERQRSSPRVAGAWVFDSIPRVLATPELESSVLWCPAQLSETASGQSCPILPNNADIELGPFTFGSLPILPDRSSYLDFVETYSKRQAGEVLSLTFSAPSFATTTEHIDLGSFGAITFLNEESIYAATTDAFSYCPVDSPLAVYVRSDLLASPDLFDLFAEDCESGALDPTFCDALAAGVLPLSSLPDWHAAVGEERYELGIYWDFPFLLYVEYEAFLSGAVSAFSFSVPFGIASDGESYLGSFIWTSETFDIEDEIAQCTRFCDHPTFDSAGVYHVTDPFRSTYTTSCFRPAYPRTTDGGFPSDP
ncbi:MAG: hypothetical protein ACI9VR_004347 [Cognaticolwellia sp.]|jgi:hypothetical protein